MRKLIWGRRRAEQPSSCWTSLNRKVFSCCTTASLEAPTVYQLSAPPRVAHSNTHTHITIVLTHQHTIDFYFPIIIPSWGTSSSSRGQGSYGRQENCCCVARFLGDANTESRLRYQALPHQLEPLIRADRRDLGQQPFFFYSLSLLIRASCKHTWYRLCLRVLCHRNPDQHDQHDHPNQYIFVSLFH